METTMKKNENTNAPPVVDIRTKRLNYYSRISSSVSLEKKLDNAATQRPLSPSSQATPQPPPQTLAALDAESAHILESIFGGGGERHTMAAAAAVSSHQHHLPPHRFLSSNNSAFSLSIDSNDECVDPSSSLSYDHHHHHHHHNFTTNNRKLEEFKRMVDNSYAEHVLGKSSSKATASSFRSRSNSYMSTLSASAAASIAASVASDPLMYPNTTKHPNVASFIINNHADNIFNNNNASHLTTAAETVNANDMDEMEVAAALVSARLSSVENRSETQLDFNDEPCCDLEKPVTTAVAAAACKIPYMSAYNIYATDTTITSNTNNNESTLNLFADTTSRTDHQQQQEQHMSNGRLFHASSTSPTSTASSSSSTSPTSSSTPSSPVIDGAVVAMAVALPRPPSTPRAHTSAAVLAYRQNVLKAKPLAQHQQMSETKPAAAAEAADAKIRIKKKNTNAVAYVLPAAAQKASHDEDADDDDDNHNNNNNGDDTLDMSLASHVDLADIEHFDDHHHNADYLYNNNNNSPKNPKFLDLKIDLGQLSGDEDTKPLPRPTATKNASTLLSPPRRLQHLQQQRQRQQQQKLKQQRHQRPIKEQVKPENVPNLVLDLNNDEERSQSVAAVSLAMSMCKEIDYHHEMEMIFNNNTNNSSSSRNKKQQQQRTDDILSSEFEEDNDDDDDDDGREEYEDDTTDHDADECIVDIQPLSWRNQQQHSSSVFLPTKHQQQPPPLPLASNNSNSNRANSARLVAATATAAAAAPLNSGQRGRKRPRSLATTTNTNNSQKQRSNSNSRRRNYLTKSSSFVEESTTHSTTTGAASSARSPPPLVAQNSSRKHQSQQQQQHKQQAKANNEASAQQRTSSLRLSRGNSVCELYSKSSSRILPHRKTSIEAIRPTTALAVVNLNNNNNNNNNTNTTSEEQRNEALVVNNNNNKMAFLSYSKLVEIEANSRALVLPMISKPVAHPQPHSQSSQQHQVCADHDESVGDQQAYAKLVGESPLTKPGSQQQQQQQQEQQQQQQQRESNGVNWLTLPDEIWLKVFSMLKHCDVARIGSTCKRFNSLYLDTSLCKKN